jgi:hydrogenase maturation protease
MRLLIGYGNPLRCDDGLGQYIAETLGQGWDVMTCTQLTPELAEPISRAERAVFIDAGVGETPGEVISEKIEPTLISGVFTHNVTPASLLASARELYEASPPALLISITGASFEYGCNLSPTIHARLSEITRRVEEAIAAFQHST